VKSCREASRREADRAYNAITFAFPHVFYPPKIYPAGNRLATQRASRVMLPLEDVVGQVIRLVHLLHDSSSCMDIHASCEIAGTRGARRQQLRAAYLTLSSQERNDLRYQMAEMRLQAEMQDRECSVEVDLAATNPRLPLATRSALF